MSMPPSAERPFQPEHQQTLPEFTVPPEALIGDEAREAFRAELLRLCRTNDWPSQVAEAALSDFEQLMATVKPGEPILNFSRYYGQLKLIEGGIALSQPYVLPGMDSLEVHVPMWHVSFLEKYMTYNTSKPASYFLRDKQAPAHGTVFMAGEEAVHEYARSMGGKLGDPNLTPEQIRHYIDYIDDLTLPFEYFGMSDEARYNLANGIMEHLVARANGYGLVEDVRVFAYVTEMTELVQYEAFYELLEEQWASLLELHPDDERVNVVGRVSEYGKLRAPSENADDFSVVTNAREELNNEIAHFSSMADLYARRAEQEHAAGSRREQAILPRIELTEPPEPRDLTIFTSWRNENTIAADVRYLREVRAAGYPVDFALERNEDSMYRGIAALAEYSLSDIDAAHRLEVFDAMEYLFDLKREEQRDELYRLLCKRFAIKIPIEGRHPIKGYICVAEAIGVLMPNPPEAADGTAYEGPARTAALLSLMYRNRARQLMAKYIPTDEQEEG